MAKFLSIIIIGLFYQICLFEASTLLANTFSLSSISVEGNKRISDQAIVNYSELDPSNAVSSEVLNDAYNKILNTGLFKVLNLSSRCNLVIIIEEDPTINEISFEGNKKFTDEKLSSLESNQDLFLPKKSGKILQSYKNYIKIRVGFQR